MLRIRKNLEKIQEWNWKRTTFPKENIIRDSQSRADFFWPFQTALYENMHLLQYVASCHRAQRSTTYL